MAFMMEFNTICRPDGADTHFSVLQEHKHKQAAANDERTWHARYEPKRPQHPERPESFDVQASGFSCSMVGLSGLVIGHGFRDHTEQPAQTEKKSRWTLIVSQKSCRLQT